MVEVSEPNDRIGPIVEACALFASEALDIGGCKASSALVSAVAAMISLRL